MIRHATIPEELPCCCGSWAWTTVGYHAELSRDEPVMVDVQYWACKRCGAIAKLPQPPLAALRAYYEGSWQYSSPRPGMMRTAGFIVRGMRQPDGYGKFPLRAGPEMGQSSFHGNGKMLEVAAKGDDLYKAMETLGVRFLGHEMYDAQPQKDGIQAAWLGSGEHFEVKERYALVAAAHVLEHVIDPYQFMVDLSRLCAPLGFIYIEVPSLSGGRFDIGLCDDANRNHLWHFGIAGLAAIGSRIGAVISVETDTSLPGWPVDRMVVQNFDVASASREWLGLTMMDVRCEYEKAELALISRTPETTALYGASHSYAWLRKLWKNEGRRYKVYDRYKAGQNWDGVTVRHPDQLVADGIREVYVTTRSYNSYLDIKRDLYERYPWLSVETLYPNIREACGEPDSPARF